jgi:ribosome-binding protein aMBF1 (putative translation factor)
MSMRNQAGKRRRRKKLPGRARDKSSLMQRDIGNQIRRVRLQRGLSQQKLARKAGIHPGHLGQVERGEVNFGMGTLVHIARAFDMKVAKFLKGIA